jgi:hypothetical protein
MSCKRQATSVHFNRRLEMYLKLELRPATIKKMQISWRSKCDWSKRSWSAKRWTTSNSLTADKSNFAQWTRELRETGSSHLSDDDFFFKPCGNSTFEKIGRLVLMASINQSLTPDVQQLARTCDMYTTLKKKFSVVSKAAQMSAWH